MALMELSGKLKTAIFRMFGVDIGLAFEEINVGLRY